MRARRTGFDARQGHSGERDWGGGFGERNLHQARDERGYSAVLSADPFVSRSFGSLSPSEQRWWNGYNVTRLALTGLIGTTAIVAIIVKAFGGD